MQVQSRFSVLNCARQSVFVLVLLILSTSFWASAAEEDGMQPPLSGEIAAPLVA